jgi:RNA polymerase sigma-70 factor (ECF subfamily)
MRPSGTGGLSYGCKQMRVKPGPVGGIEVIDETAASEPPGTGSELDARFRMFVASHRDRAQRLAWRLVGGDAAAAEDVTQEALVKAYRALGRFREEASLASWFYRIVVRQAHNYRRWQAVREVWHGIWARGLPDAVPQEPRDPLLRRRIAAALEQLSRGQKEAFVLVHLEGFSVHETATLLGKSDGTVKSHLHRALQTLRHELADLTEATKGSEG